MVYRLPPLTALRAFEAAARHLSFKKAAAELHVTPAAISQQIKLLESYLGLELFERLTRALNLTSAGLAMLPKLREGFDCLAASVEFTREPGEGELTVKAPPSFASRWLIPRLPSFNAQYPDISLRLTSSPDAVDHRDTVQVFDDTLVDPRAAGSELAIRYGTGHYPGFLVEKIFVPECCPVCSPSLVTPEKPLNKPEDLRYHALVQDETISDARNPHGDWLAWLQAAGVDARSVHWGHRFSDAVLAVNAALGGQGVVLALKEMVMSEVTAGRLLMPFDITVTSPYAYYLVMPEFAAQRPSVVAFRDWLMREGENPPGA